MAAIQIAKEGKEEKEEVSLTLKSIKKIYLFLDKLGYSRSMTKKTPGRKTTKWRKLADSEVLEEGTEVQSEWKGEKPPKTYIPDNSFVPIIKPITDIESLLELYADDGKSRWLAAAAAAEAHALDSTWDENMPFSLLSFIHCTAKNTVIFTKKMQVFIPSRI